MALAYLYSPGMKYWYDYYSKEPEYSGDCDPRVDKDCCDITKGDCGVKSAEKDSWGESGWAVEFL